MRLSVHFTLGEMLRSDTAARLNIPNIPLKRHVTALQNLCLCCLEPTRQHFRLPLRVNSGYRCPLLNEKVGGVANSQHREGEAADIIVPRSHWPFCVTTEEQMARILFGWMRDCLDTYDQLLLEHRGSSWWIHVSCRIDLRKNRLESIDDQRHKKIRTKTIPALK